MKADLKNNQVVLTFAWSPRILAFVKSLPGRKYDPGSRTWTISVEIAHQFMKELIQWKFEMSDDLVVELTRLEGLKNDLNALSRAETAEFDSRLPLLPYQRAGAKFLKLAGSAILGDDVGLGKTIQTLAILDQNPGQHLIFCPAILKYQWETEIKKFIPDAKVQVISGTPKQRINQWFADAKYFIVNYELLLRKDDFIMMEKPTWDYIITDEATRIASATAKTTKAIKKLKANHRIALTGTLISNRAEEAWSVVDFVAPGALGNYWNFLTRYCVKNQWGGIQSYTNLDELNERIKRFMIRRTKDEVLKELPEKFVSDIPVEMAEEEKKLYQQLKKELLFEIEPKLLDKVESPVMIQNTLVKMTRLRQLANSMELLGQGSTSSKLEALKAILESLKERKIIIFTEFSGMADILQREIGGLKITGEIDQNERSDILQKFNFVPDHKILILTSAGKFGLNIQAASVVIHYDQPWSLASIIQREGRAHRMGQKENVLVYNLLCRGTMDMYIKNILRKKQELSDRILLSDIKEMLDYGD